MQNTTFATRVTPGATVYGSDDHKIGTVADVGSSHFIIEKGFIFTTDIYVPMSAVASVGEDDSVYLSMTKDQIEHQDWSTAPSGDDTWRGSEAHAGTSGYAGTDTDTARDVIERREERLTVDRQSGQTGSVHVDKHVVEDEQSVDVPVTREEAFVERRPVDRAAGSTDLSDESIDVPLYGEQVSTGKETRVVEEVEVGKTPRTETQRVTDTVRREEFDIDDDSDRTNR